MHQEWRRGIRDRLRELVGLDIGPATKPGFGMDDLAEGTEVPYRTLQNWIGGRRENLGDPPDISAAFVIEAARTAGVSLEWLMTGEGTPKGGAPVGFGPIPSREAVAEMRRWMDAVLAPGHLPAGQRRGGGGDDSG